MGLKQIMQPPVAGQNIIDSDKTTGQLTQQAVGGQFGTPAVTLPDSTLLISTSPQAMLPSLYIIGGQQRSARSVLDHDQHWYDYQKGLILRIDPVGAGVPVVGATEMDDSSHRPADFQVSTCAEYISPPEATAPGAPILYKSGCVRGNRLYACTQTEVIVYALPSFEQIAYISLPCFNDVHHVVPTAEGTLLVAVSGLDLVVEITLTGEVIGEWDVYDGQPWSRFARTTDYRRGISTKPHQSHPNFIGVVPADATRSGQEEFWVTRFEQRDAIRLARGNGHKSANTGGRDKPGAAGRIAINRERVHDGYFHGGRLYYTTVDGHVVIANPLTTQIEEVIDLGSMHAPDELLGWCRGIWVQDNLAWIGFSRIRPTKFREAVSWVRVGFKQSLPTHIACYDLATRRCVRQISLEEYGLNAVFSIFPAAMSD